MRSQYIFNTALVVISLLLTGCASTDGFDIMADNLQQCQNQATTQEESLECEYQFRENLRMSE